MRKHVLPALLALVVVMLAGTVSTAAAAYTTNTECLGCHSVPVSQDTTGVVFTAAPVSLTACPRCHAGLTSTTLPEVLQHKHFSGSCIQVNCHPGWAPIYVPTYPPPSVNTAYGWFQSTASTRTPAAQLHAIHSGANWVMEDNFMRFGCRRCHGAVACSRCHGGDSTIKHGRHAVSEYPTVSALMSTGSTYTTVNTTCINPSCHALADAGTDAFTPFCGDCHTTNINEHGGDHSFSSASDYVGSSQSGCTNSGQGCHGADESRSDIRGYGHTGCQDGPCHMSADKPGVSPPLDCLKCHGAPYEGAPQVGDLTTQHYSASLHRTDLLYMTDTWISAGGFAKAACNYCHYADLAAEHAMVGSGSSGADLDCAECHNNVTSNGYAVVSADWPGRTCESCHSPFSATPFHGTSLPIVEGVSSGCGASGIGCHESNDLHALHKDEGSCQDGCHGPDLLPTKRSCGADDSDCHIGKVDTHYSASRHTATGDISGMETVACSTCHTALLGSAHSATPAASCIGCHGDPVAAAVITATAPWDKNCSACHTTRHGELESDHQGDPTGANTCMGAECHENDSIDLRVVHASLPNGCELTGCHTAEMVDAKPTGKTCGEGGACHDGLVDGNHGSHSFSSASDYSVSTESGCTNSGDGCHRSDSTYLISTYHTGCEDGDCHASSSKDGFTETFECVNCHDGSYEGAPVRANLASDHYAYELHVTNQAYMTDQWMSAGGSASATCDFCHYSGLLDEHGTVTSDAYGSDLGCHECHNDIRSNGLAQVSASWPDKTCEACHSLGSITPFHGLTPPEAPGVSAGCGASGNGCHASNDLHELHKDAASCQSGCHSPELLPTARSCGGADSDCHVNKTATHYSETTHTATGDIAGVDTIACIKCHSTVLPAAHRFNTADTCLGCHNATRSVPVIKALAGWDKNCSACHETRHGDIETNHQGDPTGANTCMGSQCHDGNSIDLRVVHASLADGCELSGCHTAATIDTKPEDKTCGDGGDCHDGFADGNHGEHIFTSASDYSTTTASGCTNSGVGCHGSDSTYVISAYHVGCSDSTCHESESKPSFSETFECVNCHDGSFAGAPNAVGNAHYDVNTHTATGDISGTETLPCTECHSASLSPAHVNTDTKTCYQCHNSLAGAAVVTSLTGWDKNCSACHEVRHTEKDTTAHAGVTPADTNCMGSRCHEYDSTDLRIVHTESGCKIEGCHDTLDTAPTEKECKACHPGLADGSHCSGPVAEPYNGCDGAGCHSVSADIHDVPQHPQLCGSCHWLQYDQACICHNKASIHAGTTHSSTDCLRCHISGTSMPHGMITLKLTTPSSWSNACGGCHGDTHSDGEDCLRCHPKSALHSEDDDHVKSGACKYCHSIPAADSSLVCLTCHPGGANAQDVGDDNPYSHCRDCHGSTHRSGDDCRSCHSASRIHSDSHHSDRGCDKCHGAADSMGGDGGTQPGLVPDPYAGCTGTNCHSVYTDVHRWPSHPKECVDCHNVAPGDACSGSTCHDKGQIHPVYNHTRVDCMTCHQNGLPKPHVTVTSKLGTITANWKTQCGTCHGNTHKSDLCWNCHSPVDSYATDTNGDGVINYYDSWGSNHWYSGGEDVHEVGNHMTNSKCGYCHAIASVDTALNCLSCHPDGRPAQLGFTTETTGTIAGQVIDANGIGIGNANVNVESITIQTDLNGYYRIINLTPGTKTVTVSKIGYLTQSKSVDVVVGMANICDFQLLPALGGINGMVTDVGGNGIAGVTVAVAGDGHTITDTSGAYALSGLPNGTYTLTYSLTGYTSQTTSVTVAGSMVTKNVTLASPSRNIAFNKVATASSQYSSTYGAAKAFDGTTSTYWRSGSSGTQWLKVDLGSIQSVSKVAILWSGTYYAKAYRVETSADGVNWVTKYSTTNAGIGTKTHNFSATNARYVRLYCTSAYTSSYRVNEFQVWNY